MKMPRQKSPAQLQKEVEDFNDKNKIGDTEKLHLDSGEIKEVSIKHEATILGGHTAVGWFAGINGCYALEAIVN